MMFSGEQNESHEIVIEANYRGKRSEGRITLISDLQTVIDHVEGEFKTKGFNVRYISESSMEGKRDFNMSKPFQRIGAIEISFFQYSEQLVAYYKIDNLWGLEYLTFAILVIYGGTTGAWLGRHGISMDMIPVITPLVLLIGLFAYQRISNLKFLKRVIHDLFG